MARRHEKTKMTRVMASLARSEKVALDTLERVKAKLISASFYSDKSESECGNYKGEEVSLVEDSVKDKAIIENHTKHGLHQVQKKGFMSVLSQPVSDDSSWKLFEYYMDRISFQCECHLNNLPTCAFTKADKLHCQRFHKDVLQKNQKMDSHKS